MNLPSSFFIAIIPTYLLGQMYANPPEFESQGTILNFRKRNKFLRCLFTLSIKHEIRHFHVLLVQKRRNPFLARFRCRRVRLNLKVPNLKKILGYLQPKPGGMIDYGSWPKQSPHHNTISRYTSRVNLILTILRTKIPRVWGSNYHCYKGYNTKGIIP